MSTLDEIGLHHGTDKTTSLHGYTLIYERYFGHLRDEAITLLEYGVGGYGDPHQGGASLRMWADYFGKATVIGVDIERKNLALGERVHVYQGDQGDPLLAEAIEAVHGPLDIVIDDASHEAAPTVAAFKAIWPNIKRGGFYVCEDAGYTYPGAPTRPGGPLTGKFGPHDGPTVMRFFERMADDINRHGYPAKFWRGYDLEFAHFWRDLVILRKQP